MSSPNPPDPRLLLPEWLRDGDALPEAIASAPVPSPAPAPVSTALVEHPTPETRETAPSAAAPLLPFSDRLSLDTRLDPGQLVSAADLPAWLGGLERVAQPISRQPVAGKPTSVAVPLTASAATIAPDQVVEIEDDAPDDGVVDVEVSGWILVAAAIGLLILLGAALRLYLS